MKVTPITQDCSILRMKVDPRGSPGISQVSVVTAKSPAAPLFANVHVRPIRIELDVFVRVIVLSFEVEPTV